MLGETLLSHPRLNNSRVRRIWRSISIVTFKLDVIFERQIPGAHRTASRRTAGGMLHSRLVILHIGTRTSFYLQPGTPAARLILCPVGRQLELDANGYFREVARMRRE